MGFRLPRQQWRRGEQYNGCRYRRQCRRQRRGWKQYYPQDQKLFPEPEIDFSYLDFILLLGQIDYSFGGTEFPDETFFYHLGQIVVERFAIDRGKATLDEVKVAMGMITNNLKNLPAAGDRKALGDFLTILAKFSY